MKKIAILRCFKVSKKCTGSSCKKAFKNKTASFNDYEHNSEMVMDIPCTGCSTDSLKEIIISAKKFKKQGVESIHLSTCIKLNCAYYDEFIEELSNDFLVVGYTHALKNNKKA